MQKTPIEWTDYSVNPFKMKMPDGTLINVCIHKSEGCRNCYAESIVRRWWKKDWGEFPGYTAALLKLGEPVLVEEELRAVLRLSDRIARGKADPSENKIFWNDMTDEFLDFWPDEFIDKCFAVRALTPNLIHQVLTKRADRLCAYLMKKELEWEDWGVSEYADELGFDFMFDKGELRQDLKDAGWWIDYEYDEDGGKDGWRTYYGGKTPLPNVHLGVSVEDQKTADERIPLLLETPATVRWLSCEPLLGPINLKLDERWCERTASAHDCDTIGDLLHWVVVGGESGTGARPMHPTWALSLRDQCVTAGVKFFFKQYGNWKPVSQMSDAEVDQVYVPRREGEMPDSTRQCRVANRILLPDGQESGEYGPGAMLMLNLGKKVAGRLLDGREWSEFPNQEAQ